MHVISIWGFHVGGGGGAAEFIVVVEMPSGWLVVSSKDGTNIQHELAPTAAEYTRGAHSEHDFAGFPLRFGARSAGTGIGAMHAWSTSSRFLPPDGQYAAEIAHHRALPSSRTIAQSRGSKPPRRVELIDESNGFHRSGKPSLCMQTSPYAQQLR